MSVSRVLNNTWASLGACTSKERSIWLLYCVFFYVQGKGGEELKKTTPLHNQYEQIYLTLSTQVLLKSSRVES